MSTYENYLKVKAEREAAEVWNNLPNGPKYQNDTMEIRASHCKLELMRMGQQVCGGNNYWVAPKALCEAVLQVLAQHSDVIDYAIANMIRAEKDALIACEKETRDRLADIEKAKAE